MGAKKPQVHKANGQLKGLLKPLDDVYESENNPRIHDDRSVASIAASLNEFGQQKPIVVREDDEGRFRIVAGHGMFRAAHSLGWTHIAAVMFDRDDARALGYMEADNRTAMLSEWDEPKHAELLNQLAEHVSQWENGFESLGYDEKEFFQFATSQPEEELGEGTEPEPLPKAKPITQDGELLELGNHRLVCGSCADEATVMRLMDGNKAHLFATDPPYLVGYTGADRPSDSIDWSDEYGKTWDEKDPDCALYKEFMTLAKEKVIRPNAAWYIWHASTLVPQIMAIWKDLGVLYHQTVVWVKDQQVMSYSIYHWKHEPCLVGWIQGNKPYMTKVQYPTVWEMARPKSSREIGHMTSKPLDAFGIPMRKHTKKNDICYEPFGGSGSQLIAAEQLGRRCFATEINPVFCDVIVRRWIEQVGKENAPAKLVKRYGT